jgi:hypothetical protein
MSLLPECPCCGGLMTGNIRTTLSSACRCGYPEKVTWNQFKEKRERADLDPKPLGDGRWGVAA